MSAPRIRGIQLHPSSVRAVGLTRVVLYPSCPPPQTYSSTCLRKWAEARLSTRSSGC